MDSALERQLTILRDKLTKAQQAESLFVCHSCGKPHDGYEYLKGELEKMIAALRDAAVSPKSLDSQVAHASTVGAHNALKSLLDTVEVQARNAAPLSARVQQIESDNAEELERLGNTA